MFKSIRRYLTPGLHRVLVKASKQGARKFLVAWNRGLGDIPLGLYAFTVRVKQYIPDAEITFLTRPELVEAFYLLDDAKVLAVPSWEREDGTPDVNGMRMLLAQLNIPPSRYDVIMNVPDPKGELKDCRGKLTPRLSWKPEYDQLQEKFGLTESHRFVGAHVNTETSRFYGYTKDWPAEHWRALFEKISQGLDAKVLLFGTGKKDSFDMPSVIDLRGKTSLLEMLSVIRKHCSALVAPDSGVLSVTYYLDTYFPITVVSLWADPRQGILKQAVDSPNKGLTHVPLIGRHHNVSEIKVADVFSVIAPLLI